MVKRMLGTLISTVNYSVSWIFSYQPFLEELSTIKPTILGMICVQPISQGI